MIHLSEKTWRFPDTGMTLPFVPANILVYLLGQNETLFYDFATPTTTITHNYDTTAHTSTYAEVQVYYYGYRYYSPELGRWVSRDPLGEEENLVSLYVAFENDPIASIDLLGKLSLPPGYPREPTMPEEGDIRGHCFDVDVGVCCLILKGAASGFCAISCLDCLGGSKLGCLKCISCAESSRHAPDCITCKRWGCQKCSSTGEWGEHKKIYDEPTSGGTWCYYSSGCAVYQVLDSDGYCETLTGPLTEWDEVPCPSGSEE